MALTETQLIERKGYIGGSDVAAILGLNKYQTPLDVYLSKKGLTEPFAGNEFTYCGNMLEPVIINMFAEREGVTVTEPTQTYYNKDYPFLAANVDGLISGTNEILECKNAGYYMRNFWGEDGSDHIPDSYLCQVAHYASILDADRVHIAVLIGGNDLRLFKYERNLKFENLIRQEMISFWHNHMLKDEPPQPSTLDEVKSIYPESSNSVCIASNEDCDLYFQYKDNDLRLKELSAEQDEIKKQLMLIMKTDDALTDVSGQILCTWKQQTTNRIDTKLLRKKFPDIIDELTTPSISRRFLIK